MPAEHETCPPAPDGLRIEAAKIEDADLLCGLIRELAEFENLLSECHITVEAVREHLLGEKRSAEAVIAWAGGQVAGFAVYYRTFSTFAARPGVFLEDLYVKPIFRKVGIGKALLREVGRIAHAENAGRYEWTTLTWNQNARRLYASIGAKEMHEWMLLRMEAEDLASFACDGRGLEQGRGHSGCRCGGKGPGHIQKTQ